MTALLLPLNGADVAFGLVCGIAFLLSLVWVARPKGDAR